MSTPYALVHVERVIWSPGELWRQAVGHLGSRFARVRPLDIAGLDLSDEHIAGHGIALHVAALREWAGSDIAWERELARFFDEHLALHVRPDRSVTRPLRALATGHDVEAFSALPEGAMHAVLRHAGALRPLRATHSSVRLLPEVGTRASTAAAGTPVVLSRVDDVRRAAEATGLTVADDIAALAAEAAAAAR